MPIENPIILLVEDCENDALLMRTAFRRVGFALPLQFANDGDEAIAYLRGDGVYDDRDRFPLPTAVLLDLKMPRKDGFAVLEWINSQQALEKLSVYVLTASSRPEDIKRARDLGANCYLVKPTSLDELMDLAKSLLVSLNSGDLVPLEAANGNHDRPSMRWFFTSKRHAKA